MQFTKLFNSILDSTIWQEPLETKVVWITMLAMVDCNGDVHASIPGLAKRAGVTIEQCKDALTCLQSPDEFSRTKDHEGRRIKEIDGGWELLNHAKYRTLLSAEERREYNRRKQAEYRNVKKVSNNVKQCQTKSAQCTHTDAESDTDAEVNTVPPNPQGGTDGEEKPSRKKRNAEYLQTTETIWPLFPAISRERSSKLRLDHALRKAHQKPSDIELILSLNEWSESEAWTKDGGQYAPAAHRWVKDRKWEVKPAPPAIKPIKPTEQSDVNPNNMRSL